MAIVRLDKVKAAYIGNLESIKYGSADIKNGTIWVLGGLANPSDPEQNEVHSVSPATSANVADRKTVFVLHASGEVLYDETQVGLDKYVLKAGDVGRAYHLSVGDVFTITTDLFDPSTTLNPGDYVGPSPKNAGLWQKLNGSDQVTDGTTPAVPNLICRVMCADQLGPRGNKVTAYQLKVVRNGQ